MNQPIEDRVTDAAARVLNAGGTTEQAASAARAEAEKYGTADLKAADARLAEEGYRP